MLSYNVRGLGDKVIWRFVRELVIKENIQLLCVCKKQKKRIGDCQELWGEFLENHKKNIKRFLSTGLLIINKAFLEGRNILHSAMVTNKVVEEAKRRRNNCIIFPFLFTIVVEGLSGMMKEATSKNMFEGFHNGKNEVEINLLQYANDTLFFGKTIYLSFFKMSLSIEKKLARIQKDFLWGCEKGKQKISWVFGEQIVLVIIRVRPLNNMERCSQGYNRCLKQESSQCITWIGQPENRFTFDHVACETIDQEMIFRLAGLPMVENCLSGYNSCMFAYGQTGSGKTYTMLGDIEDLDVKPSTQRGMTPRIFEFLFARIQAEEESRRDENLKYNCKCSFLEIYNEQITDLLDPCSTNLLLREDVKKGVYVENLSEFEVQSVSDIIRLLTQGSANRKVAATNMNRESSRSHSVFTCVIESTWEKDSTTNYRFARLNLVDLAGSERQKTSGAEGERLKEAANINKSLSTLGHVIMILVDVANGKQRHVPYRDSRLTFLLQDSLGGNSKTMIIANVSPSICCAAETLNTLKFAQRAKLIQNNAVVNEDSTGDVVALQHQIRLLKEELSTLKRRQNVSRSLSFSLTSVKDIKKSLELEDFCLENAPDMVDQNEDIMPDYESNSIRMSHKQLKSLETTLAGALRREQMAEISIKQLEAEIEQLNRLVRQREEDTRSCKMMLRFREDKIRRLESRLSGSVPTETFLQEENKALYDEIQILQGRLDRNPEVTRFAVENIRLLDQLRRYQEFYEEGEREILLTEVSSLREQDSMIEKPLNVTTAVHGLQLRNTLDELQECRRNLNYCLEENAKLSREIDSLHSTLSSTNATKVSTEGSFCEAQAVPQIGLKHETQVLKHTEDILNLQLELDIIKVILKEERTFRGLLEDQTTCLNQEFLMAKDKLKQTSKQLEDTNDDLKEAKYVIEALESQHILSIKEIEEMRNKNNHYLELMGKQEHEILTLKNQLASEEFRDNLPSNHVEFENESPLQVKLRRMHNSLEKAKQLNMSYQNDRAFQMSNEEEMDEIRRQAEAETAEVIVCMQEELALLQDQVNDGHLKEIEMKESMLHLETELKEVQQKLLTTIDDNRCLKEELGQKDIELISLVEEWELLTTEIQEILVDGCEALVDASNELGHISNSFPQKRIWISEQVGMIVRKISEKELLIDELRRCLEDASNKRSDMECMLKSLRSAALVITESHQKECAEKEKEILLLISQLSEKTSTVKQLKEQMDALLIDQSTSLSQAERQIAELLERCNELSQKLSEEQEHSFALEQKLEDFEKNAISKTREQLATLQDGVSSIRSCMTSFADHSESLNNRNSMDACTSDYDVFAILALLQTISETHQNRDSDPISIEEPLVDLADLVKNEYDKKEKESRRVCKDVHEKDVTITLLRKEIECALESLKEVQYEMAKLHEEKKEMSLCEKKSQQSIGCLTNQILFLQEAMNHFMHTMLFSLQSLELEVGEAKIVQAQTAQETSCILAKFGEAQDTMREADIMINGLVIANESMKIDIERLKDREKTLLKDLVESSLVETRDLIVKLDDVIKEVQLVMTENFWSLACDLECFKSQFLYSTKLIQPWLEKIWSEIIFKDCAMSVLHLCHMGILLETVTGMHAENGLLSHGLCESNSVISDLKEHNYRTKQELDMCRILKGKLLADIKNSFDRITKKEFEAGEITIKLNTFAKNISDLQLQEEMMLQRSNEMGSQLAKLMRELDVSNTDIVTSLLDQEKLLKQKVDAIESQAEFLMADWYAKDFESLIHASELKNMSCNIASMEEHFVKYSILIEQLKTETIFSKVETELAEQILMDKEAEVSLLEREIQQTKVERQDLMTELNRKVSRITEMGEVNKVLEQNIEFLKDVSCSNNALKGELVEVKEAKKRLLDKILDLEADYDKLIGDVIEKDVASEFSFHQISFLEQQNVEFKKVNYILENSSCRLKNELNLKDSELTRMQSLLQVELSRKDDVIKGLLYDLSLLQESASNNKDQKDEIEKIVATMEALEVELAEREALKLQVSENQELRTNIEDALAARILADNELTERMKITESLEDEILEMNSVTNQMNDSIKNLSSDLDELTIERDQLQAQVICLKNRLEKAEAQVEANEAIAQEAQKVAETRKIYAEDREEEVKLLERSVEELENTINVLENKVDIIKGEAERQRLQREDLELELHALKDQMQNVRNADGDIRRFLEEKEKSLNDALNHIQVLKRELTGKDTEIQQMKAHISELNLHAEAQAKEYKQKFKALEAMAEQVKPEGLSTHSIGALSNKSEKNATKSRGSGSPFKCIGLGLTQQIKYEKVEELAAARQRIEELESQAACRQREIFALNAKLANAESMTHDVIRDLLGVKLDMTTCVSLLDDGQQAGEITEKVQFLTLEPQDKEVIKLKQQLNEFIEERKGWLQEMDRKQAELVAVQIALENLRQRDQFLNTENEMLKTENSSKKNKIMELEEEMKKLSGQQNLQQRIHHHAKIKEENNKLKIQNEELSAKLRRADIFVSRVKEDLARLRASAGVKTRIDIDEEQRLMIKLKEIEEEKVQLAQQLLRLSTNVLKVAGIERPTSDVNPSMAEEALKELKNRITSMEMEQEDLKFKNKIINEKIRLSELMPQASPLNSRSEENRLTPPRSSLAPFLSSFDR
uniref:Kinesin-like protein KIF15 n=1 Tax=Cajanus cajan TaxID=3821 RepID=A0A151S4V0_CAJCA|nr:Kinesin-like protein KIF15 [Cajanus cajan]